MRGSAYIADCSLAVPLSVSPALLFFGMFVNAYSDEVLGRLRCINETKPIRKVSSADMSKANLEYQTSLYRQLVS
jgi:hypothetical protein